VAIGALVATSVVATSRLVDLDRLVWPCGRVESSCPILAYMFTVAWIGSARGTAHFDAVGAQVIAVLVLVLVLRSTCCFRLAGTRDRLEVMSTCLATLLLGIGELYRVRCAFTGQPRHGETVAAAIAVGFTAVAVAVSALVRPLQAAAEEERRGSGARRPTCGARNPCRSSRSVSRPSPWRSRRAPGWS
jgi:hypothetical protein